MEYLGERNFITLTDIKMEKKKNWSVGVCLVTYPVHSWKRDALVYTRVYLYWWIRIYSWGPFLVTSVNWWIRLSTSTVDFYFSLLIHFFCCFECSVFVNQIFHCKSWLVELFCKIFEDFGLKVHFLCCISKGTKLPYLYS